MIHWIEWAACGFGLVLSVIVAILPRFGPGSRQLIFLMLPAALSAGIQAAGQEIAGISEQNALRLSLALLIFAAAGGYLAVLELNRQEKRLSSALINAVSFLLIALLYLIAPPYLREMEEPEGFVALGYIGYLSSLFLLVVSVIVLAKIEQIMRGSSETARWGSKYLFLGIASLYAAIVYLSSQVLLYRPSAGLLSVGSLRLFHMIAVVSFVLIAFWWKRGSGGTRITVSHGLVYSSITLLSIGIYLIASSILARWASQWSGGGLPLGAFIFLSSAIVLVAALLGTAFRHRARRWLRKNIFAGRYDYRKYWLDATERIRSIDSPDQIAGALADIVHQALGAIDVSVWRRLWDPNRLHLLKTVGAIPDTIEQEVTGLVEQILTVSEPLSLEDLEALPDSSSIKDLMEKTRASLLVPLLSSNRIVGIITLGSDRSGKPYDWEAREFLRALAGYAAGEFHKFELLATLVETKEAEAFRAFSTFMLHDLKNFASTLSYIAQNAPRHQNNADFQQDAFQSVYDTAEKMKRMCNSLKTFSSAAASDKKSIDLNKIVQSAADSLNAGIAAYLKSDLGEVPPLLADSEELGRVIQNLLLNAREAVAENGVIIVRTSYKDNFVHVCIEDDGKGISKEFLEQELFQPFHTTKSGGLGIGLFQSKKIVEAHRGTIKVESEEGRGTKVTLSFPIAKEETIAPDIVQISQP
jgi:putative PEP-CTERM system histidine kinase